MSLFEKFEDKSRMLKALLSQSPRDPFSVSMEEMKGPTRAMVKGKEIVLAGTNNYLGLTFDEGSKLPAPYQKLINDAKAEVDREQVKAYVEIDKKNLPMFQQRLKPVTYTKAQLEEFQRVAGRPVWDKWVEENKGRFNGQELIDAILKIAREGG